MKLLFVKNYPVSVKGSRVEGWSASDEDNSRIVLFNFEIRELENNGGFLLISDSSDEELSADTWHETLDEALKVAGEQYGVSIDLWKEIK